MDDVKVEKTPETTHTTINRTEAKPSGNGGMLWFLLGGVIVVVAIIAYFVLGDGMMISRSSEPTDGNVSVNVETNEAPTSESESPTVTEEAPAKAVPDQTQQGD
ncbi:hypothetical protein [Roseovarius nitratireducens]|uniref:hypothetical protein n=1 Tax=Roseovarius nitratireducens TaxID=2044597 RepID=UPI000CE1B7FE|nr:hypothetical protein [Roseovarius nitratireducens]